MSMAIHDESLLLAVTASEVCRARARRVHKYTRALASGRTKLAGVWLAIHVESLLLAVTASKLCCARARRVHKYTCARSPLEEQSQP